MNEEMVAPWNVPMGSRVITRATGWGIPRMIRRRLSATVSVDVDRLWIVDGFDDDNDDEYVDSVTRRITE